MERLGAEAVLEGLGSFLSGVDRMTDAMDTFGKNVETSAKHSDTLTAKGVALGTVLGNIASAALSAGAALIGGAFQQFGGFLSDSIAAANESEAAMAQLNQTIASTGGVAGVTADAAAGLAASLQDVTRFGDEAILGGENLLLTFTNIGSDIFPQATETILDMSTALGQDLKSSAVQLGKALQDPIKGVTALSRVGVNFSESQKKMIAAMVEAGDVAGAQKLILAELNVEFGGSARAAGTTAAGQIEIFKNKLNDMQEVIGGIVIPVLGQLAQIGSVAVGKLAEIFASPAVQQGMQLITQSLGALLGLLSEGDPEKRIAFFNTLAAVLGPQMAERVALITSGLIGLFGVITGSADGVQRVRDALAGLFGSGAADAIIGAVQGIGAALGELVGFIGQFVSVQDVMIAGVIALSAVIISAAIPALISLLAAAFPIVAAIGALILVVALVRTAWENDWGGIQEIVAAAWAVTQPVLAELMAWLSENIPPALETLGSVARTTWDVVATVIQAFWKQVGPIFDVFVDILKIILPLAWEQFVAGVKVQVDLLVKFIELIKPAIDLMRQAFEGLVTFLANLHLPNPFDALLAAANAVDEALRKATGRGSSNGGGGGGGSGMGGGEASPTSSSSSQPLSATTALRSSSVSAAGDTGAGTTIQVGPNYVRSQEDIHSVAYNVRRYSPAPAR